MKMKHASLPVIALLLLVLLTFSGCTSIETREEPDERIQDLELLVSTLETEHPNPYSLTNKKDVEDFFERTGKEASSMNDLSFYFSVQELVALVGDSHTMVGPPQELLQSMHAYPFQIAYIENAWRLTVVEQAYAPMLASEVLSINGISIEEILTRFRSLIGYDTEQWFRQRVAQLLNIAEYYSYLGITGGVEDPITLTIDHRTCQNISSSSISAITIEEFYQKTYATLYDTPSKTGTAQGYYRTEVLGEDTNVVFIQYNVCASHPDFSIESFTKETLKIVRERQPTTVIFDLRFNGGGDSRLAEPLIDGLSDLQGSLGFSLNVLIGERTFSSALMNAIQIRDRCNARLVGTASGGSVNHFGEVKTLLLPHSGIPFQYSTKIFTMDTEHEGDSLIPDVEIIQRVEDLLNGEDTALEALF